MSYPSAVRSRTLRPAATIVALCALLFAPPGDAPGRSSQWSSGSGGSGAVELRYFILKAGSDKSKVTENPETALAKGDQIAIRVEPTFSGHLYVFFHGDGASPAMIYPNLDNTASDVKSETAVEIPSSQAHMSQWWEVREGPGIDRFYVVLAREPLRGVPVREALVKHCASLRGRCYWKPPAPLWESIVSQARAGVLAPVTDETPDAEKPVRRPPLTLVADPGAAMAVAVVEAKIKGSFQTSDVRR